MEGNLIKNMEKLCSFGPRYSASAGEKAAGRFWAEELCRLGYVITEEKFRAPVFRDHGTSLIAGGRALAAKAYLFSCGTVGNGIESDLVFADAGSELAESECRGKIVVLTQHMETLRDFWEADVIRYSDKGAEGLIVISPDDPIFVGSVESGKFNPGSRFEINRKKGFKNIPVISIGRTDGEWLRSESANKSLRAKIQSSTTNETAEISNIIGTMAGNRHPEKQVLVLGHRDTVGNLGADDNGSGFVAMLELARLLGKENPACTLKFISTCGEEMSSAGGHDYVSRHENELKEMAAAIELDMIGGDDLVVVREGLWPDQPVYYDEGLMDRLMSIAERNRVAYFRKASCNLNCTPDSGRFAARGVPSLWLWSPNSIRYHTDEDTIDHVNFRTIHDTITVVRDLILEVDSLVTEIRQSLMV